MELISSNDLKAIREGYHSFLNSCKSENGFKLTKKSELSPYALCFAIFGYHLLNNKEFIEVNKESWAVEILQNLDYLRANLNKNELIYSKPYLQLLTFSLSCLSILDKLPNNKINNHIEPLLDWKIDTLLNEKKISLGAPGTGNMAMFWAIVLIYSNKFNVKDSKEDISYWVDYHLKSINKFGFWGNKESMNFLQFQNGYHQYEILDYLSVKGDFWHVAADSIASLVDIDGHFAPYPGGGGCYDFDAIHILTSKNNSGTHDRIIKKTLNTIMNYQNKDGGFCESKFIRPRSFKNIIKNLNHIKNIQNKNKFEVFKRIVSIQRPYHNRIHTHWTSYSREWHESDLWDSWFRMLLIARVQCYFDKTKIKDWGFINFPGIGFHNKFHS